MKEIQLDLSERIDDLQINGLKIIQSEDVFSFSLDAVLLAHFCTVPQRGKMMDLCTGNGVIPLLLTTRSLHAQLDGVEIQQRLAHMAIRSVQLNELTHRIQIYCADLKEIHLQVGHGQYDLVTVNPPYLPLTAGNQNTNLYRAIARHEMHCTLEQVIEACARCVKAGGKVALVHRPTRLVELCEIMRQYHIEPKRIRFVHASSDKEAMMVLIEGMKDGKPEVRVMPPLMIYTANQEYTDELKAIYRVSEQVQIVK
jgi:tRNA1(Val) A37 N6-methylase TrmN6